METIFVHQDRAGSPAAGDLRGLKIAVQPNISVTGWPAGAGSRALLNYTALEDATVIQRLRQSGAWVCCSTRSSEFGFGLQDSQAGEAIRTKAADAELVMDFMGESRAAAARAGICGFKPSYGLISRFGLIDLIPSMECCGILSADLDRIRQIMKFAAGPDEKDFSLPEEKMADFSAPVISPQKITTGYIREAGESLSAAENRKFNAALDEFRRAGFNIRELLMPDYPLFMLVHKIVGSVEASSCAGRYDSVRYGQRSPGAKNWNEMYLLSRGAAFGTLLKSFLFQGAYFQFERYESYVDACRIRARLLTAMQKLSEQAECLIFPGIESTATVGSLADLYTAFSTTVFANVTGQPALYLPPSSDKAGGIQLAGPRLSDPLVIALGEYLLKIRQGGK